MPPRSLDELRALADQVKAAESGEPTAGPAHRQSPDAVATSAPQPSQDGRGRSKPVGKKEGRDAAGRIVAGYSGNLRGRPPQEERSYVPSRHCQIKCTWPAIDALRAP